MTAEDALRALEEGNRRFVENKPASPRRGPERRLELAGGQRPFAAVLTCSDSRVVPEIIFDQGIGDLFVVRAAGNVADQAGRESLEYAAEHLGVPLIVVLGHTRCGAVIAALSTDPGAGAGSERGPALESGTAEDHGPPALLRLLHPAVAATRAMEGDRVTPTVLANVRMVSDVLRRESPVLARLENRGGLEMRGALYDIVSGSVEWMND